MLKFLRIVSTHLIKEQITIIVCKGFDNYLLIFFVYKMNVFHAYLFKNYLIIKYYRKLILISTNNRFVSCYSFFIFDIL